MCMRSIDNAVDIVSRVPSRTRTDALLIDHESRTRMSYVTNLFLVLTGVHGNAQETLTREKRHCESRRTAMFPHFFLYANGSLRTSLPESRSQSTSCDGLSTTHVGSRASAWLLPHETDKGLDDASNRQSGIAGSTSAGALASSKATAKTARVLHQLGPHTTSHAFFASVSLRAEFDCRDRGCL